jgi:DNA-binding MarR family transcriptional regulator
MSNKKINDKIVSIEKNFRQICCKIKQKGREILTDFEITPPQFTALLILLEEDNLTISELSNEMYLACSTVTDLLDRMEKNALVKRVKDENDRRISRIKVLEKGYTVLDEVLTARRLYISEIFKEATPEELEIVNQSFSVLNTYF